MKFDTLIIAPCANPNAPAAQVPCGSTSGSNGGTDGDGNGDDPRCSDAVFAAANPGICLTAPRLIVKPEYVLREVGKSIEFKAYLWANGVETELTDGVTWATSNLASATIGVETGNATAMSPGVVTISATYGLLSGYAQLEVIAEGECASQAVTYVLLFDISKSSGAGFSTLFPNRLAFAKDVARQFLDNLNLERDSAAVMTFSGDGSTVLGVSQDVAALKSAVNSIAVSTGTTNIQSGLQDAQELATSNRRVIVLFTDAENKEGDDPVTYADSIRGAATLIIGVGLRASGNGFKALNKIANGGFFLNATSLNQTSIATYLSGMQSYLCSGSCVPVGDVILGVGALNWNHFLKWDVTVKHVDLIGQNEGGPEFYNFEPGNGLYVDGAGSNNSSEPDLGTIQTKDLITVTAGQQLRLKVAIAGNKREDRSPDVTTLYLIDQDGNTVATLVCSVTDYMQAFTDYTLSYTVGVGVTGVRIVIAQTSIPTGKIGVFGNLWNNVRLLDVDDVELFVDTFDGENARYIPPGCGVTATTEGYEGYVGDCYSYGCLSSPIPAQFPDAAPPGDLEAVA